GDQGEALASAKNLGGLGHGSPLRRAPDRLAGRRGGRSIRGAIAIARGLRYKEPPMKKETPPDYHTVLVVDVSTGTEFLTRSTLKSERKRTIDGVEVPEIRVEISSASHPFFTGTMRELDSAGKIERFRRRYRQTGAKGEKGEK